MNELAVHDDFSPEQVMNLLSLEADPQEYWNDTMMQDFEKRYYQPMTEDLKLIAHVLEKTGNFLNELGCFVLTLVFYGINAVLALL